MNLICHLIESQLATLAHISQQTPLITNINKRAAPTDETQTLQKGQKNSQFNLVKHFWSSGNVTSNEAELVTTSAQHLPTLIHAWVHEHATKQQQAGKRWQLQLSGWKTKHSIDRYFTCKIKKVNPRNIIIVCEIHAWSSTSELPVKVNSAASYFILLMLPSVTACQKVWQYRVTSVTGHWVSLVQSPASLALHVTAAEVDLQGFRCICSQVTWPCLSRPMAVWWRMWVRLGKVTVASEPCWPTDGDAEGACEEAVAVQDCSCRELLLSNCLADSW